MELCGKKQIDIREDNKSAVIDILLQREATTSQLTEQLKLSHTALAKVLKELMQKNVVLHREEKTTSSGRPPKIYEINGECAITCVVMFLGGSVYIYYIDMRGFQVNNYVFRNEYSDAASLLENVQKQLRRLKEHPRLHDKILKYIYIGLPTSDFFGMDFSQSSALVSSFFARQFPTIYSIVYRNVDYELIAETKYGVLKDGVKNAVFFDLDAYLSASFLFGGELYSGDGGMQGYGGNLFGGLCALGDAEKVISAYNAGDADTVQRVEEYTGGVLRAMSAILRFLDIGTVVLGGDICRFGERFHSYARKIFGDKIALYYPATGKEVPSALSGAVWLATYSTLQDIILR